MHTYPEKDDTADDPNGVSRDDAGWQGAYAFLRAWNFYGYLLTTHDRLKSLPRYSDIKPHKVRIYFPQEDHGPAQGEIVQWLCDIDWCSDPPLPPV